MKRRYCIAYARTSYMEIEIDAASRREAEAMFEKLARTSPATCERAKALAPSQFRIVDLVPVEAEPARLAPAAA